MRRDSVLGLKGYDPDPCHRSLRDQEGSRGFTGVGVTTTGAVSSTRPPTLTTDYLGGTGVAGLVSSFTPGPTQSDRVLDRRGPLGEVPPPRGKGPDGPVLPLPSVFVVFPNLPRTSDSRVLCLLVPGLYQSLNLCVVSLWDSLCAASSLKHSLRVCPHH